MGSNNDDGDDDVIGNNPPPTTTDDDVITDVGPIAGDVAIIDSRPIESRYPFPGNYGPSSANWGKIELYMRQMYAEPEKPPKVRSKISDAEYQKLVDDFVIVFEVLYFTE